MGNQGSVHGGRNGGSVSHHPPHHPVSVAIPSQGSRRGVSARPRRYSDSATERVGETPGTVSSSVPCPSLPQAVSRRLSSEHPCGSPGTHQGTPPPSISVRPSRHYVDGACTGTRKVSTDDCLPPLPELPPSPLAPRGLPIVPPCQRLPQPPSSPQLSPTTRPRSKTLSARPNSSVAKKEERSKLVPTVFKFSKKPHADCVYLAGTMTQWQAVRMSKPAGESHWVHILEAKEGSHHYKFLVDGQWCIEETATIVTNTSNNQWNLIQVRKSDFEVFEALACDSFTLKDSDREREERRYRSDTWCQVSPDFQKLDIRQRSPPALPPHLLQVILNRDVSYLADPILLEEPSHVMLNHFYAQAIKDELLVLSSTQRYRKKYVTTILYKPIS